MKNQLTLHPNIARLVPMLEGTVALLHPYAEGAIHDLKEGKIIALYNNISKRSVGDSSVVAELEIDIKDFPDYFEPYYKTNWDGRELKCTSVTIRDDNGDPIGLICINFDTSVFGAMQTQLESFLKLKTGGLNPVEEFSVNWRKQVRTYTDEFLAKHSVTIQALTKQQKTLLVNELYDHGFFNYRDAATYIAQKLNVSRTTIYNYLKEAKAA